ncbi:MAG: thiol peroxidase [Campylobacter sp.]|nr:thiol peroxidase [Campylobacter sp.]
MATVTVGGNTINLAGNSVSVGDLAPIVELAGKDLNSIKVGGSSDYTQVIASVPSLDTAVCATETRKFNEQIAKIKGVKLTVVSMDLPFAMGRFCSVEGIDSVVVGSDFRNKEFANKYGVLLSEGALAGLTSRAVFVVGKNGKILHKEIVSEVTSEPNYDAIKKAIKDNGGCSNC